MNPAEYDRMYALENHYWWFVARRRLALGLLGRCLAPAKGHPTVLDFGCGTGAVLEELAQIGKYVGLDMSGQALEYCRQRGLTKLAMGRGECLPFAEDSFDAVVSLDVYEHIEKDQQALNETLRVLKPGGVLVLSVPAFKMLWGPHDVALMHHRRYRRRELSEKLESAGFKIEKLSYSVFFLFPLVVLFRIFEKRRRGSAHASLPRVPPWLNKALVGLQSIEAGLIGALSLPWGSSLVAVARKPEPS